MQAFANRKINDRKTVPVLLQKELNNPFDSHAIAFMYKVIRTGKGLAMLFQKHCLMSTIKAIDAILDVYFGWVKLKFQQITQVGMQESPLP